MDFILCVKVLAVRIEGSALKRALQFFLIMGDECTRNCKFCAIPTTAHPLPLDPDEPRRVAEMSRKLGLKHVIITSVTRDDLEDGGASYFQKTIKEIRALRGEDVFIEVLTPDFRGKESAIDLVAKEKPRSSITIWKLLSGYIRPSGLKRIMNARLLFWKE